MRAPSAVAVTAIQPCGVAADIGRACGDVGVDQTRDPSGATAGVPALASPSPGVPTSDWSDTMSAADDASAALAGYAAAIVAVGLEKSSLQLRRRIGTR